MSRLKKLIITLMLALMFAVQLGASGSVSTTRANNTASYLPDIPGLLGIIDYRGG